MDSTINAGLSSTMHTMDCTSLLIIHAQCTTAIIQKMSHYRKMQTYPADNSSVTAWQMGIVIYHFLLNNTTHKQMHSTREVQYMEVLVISSL